MEKYKLLGIRKRKSKNGNDYYILFICLENDNEFVVVNVMIDEKQIEPINKVLGDSNFDCTKYLKLKYNSFTKNYQLTFNYGL